MQGKRFDSDVRAGSFPAVIDMLQLPGARGMALSGSAQICALQDASGSGYAARIVRFEV